jgi:hypothetical protein
MTGADTPGSMRGFLTVGFDRTGRPGELTDIGKGKEHGALRDINFDRTKRDRNSDTKGRRNTSRDPRSKDICNGDKSSKDNPGSGSLKANNRDNTRSDSLSNSIPNPGAGNHSTREDPNAERRNIDSRMAVV